MRARVINVLGIDTTSRAVARLFVEFADTVASDGSRVKLVDSDDDPVPALRAQLAEQVEAQQTDAVSLLPTVTLLAAAWSSRTPDTLDALGDVSRVLDAVLPGAQSMSLVVLVPPPTASPGEKVRAFTFFLELEKLIGAVAFLDVIFVNQIRTDLHAHLQSESEGEAPDDELWKLLYKELVDGDAGEVVRRVGHAAVGLQTTVAGRKCCYATVGTHGLTYLARKGMRHLETRLQDDILNHAWLDADALSPEEIGSVVAWVDTFIDDLLAEVTSRLPDAALSDLEWQQLASDELGPGIPGEDAAAALEDRAERLATPVVEPLESRVQDALLEFLDEPIGHLARVRLCLELLRGDVTIKVGEGERAAGLKRFVERFCLAPSLVALARAIQPLPAELDSPPTEAGASVVPWLDEASDVVVAAVDDMTVGVASPLRVRATCVRLMLVELKAASCEGEAARALVSGFRDALVDEVTKLEELMGPLRERQKALRSRLRGLGWWKRTITKRGEARDIDRQLEVVAEQLDVASSAVTGTVETFRELMDHVALPHLLRAQVSVKVRQEVLRTTRAFQQFVDTLSSSVRHSWSAACRVPEWATLTESTVLTPGKLDILYATALDGRDLKEHAHAASKFVAAPTREGTAPPTYEGCVTLKDHYVAGAQSLIDRLSDYSRMIVAPLWRLDVLDIIQLEGEQEGLQLLTHKTTQTREFLPFAPGPMALVRNQRALRTVFVVQTPGGEESRIASRSGAIYANLFQPESKFLDSSPTHLQITCFHFGFPAFVIHSLHEGRQLAKESAGGPPADLWPE